MSGKKENLLKWVKSLPEGADLGELWAAVRKLLPADPVLKFCFRNRQFIRDFGAEGYHLIKNVRPQVGEVVMDAISFLNLNERETSIKGEEMVIRSEGLRGNLGQRDCEKLLAGADKIPEGLRKYYLVFTGTVWVYSVDSRRRIPCLIWHKGCWNMWLCPLDADFGMRGRILVPRRMPPPPPSRPNDALPSGSGAHEWQGPYEL